MGWDGPVFCQGVSFFIAIGIHVSQGPHHCHLTSESFTFCHVISRWRQPSHTLNVFIWSMFNISIIYESRSIENMLWPTS